MEPSQCSRRRLKLFGKPGASRRIVETRRFEGQAKQVYSLLLLQKPYGCKPEPCIGRSLVQAQSQEPSKASVLRGFFIFIALVTRHDTPIINREIHGEDLTTTHIRQTGHCQFTDERHGIPSISLGIPCKSYIETLVRGMAESIGKSGALGATPASTRFTPSMATMAPLSVQSLICGIRTSTP